MPFKEETLDVHTLEPFISDLEHKASWTPLEQMHQFRSKESFYAACDIIDNYDVNSDSFKRFKCI